MSYSYATARDTLNEGEKDRILAMHLSSDDTSHVDWDKATRAFGAASVDSMKVSYRNLLKKIEKAGGKTGITAPSTNGDSSTLSTPKALKTPKGKVGRPSKRKAENTGSDEDDDDDAPKSLRKKAAKNAVKAQDDDEDDDAPKSVRNKATKNVTRADEDDEDDGEAVKSSEKAGRPRKTSVKSTKKVAMSKIANGDGDTVDHLNVTSDKFESAQGDKQTSKMVKGEDESNS